MAQQGPNGGTENAIGYFILGILAVILAYIIWYFCEYQIKDAIRWIKWSEIWLVSWFVSPDYVVPYNNIDQINLHNSLDQIKKIPDSKLSDNAMSMINATAMYPLRYVFIALIGVMGIWAMTRGPETQFRRKLDLNGLINVQSKIFPVIAPFAKFNPSKLPVRPPGAPVPAELPLFSEALGPEEWLAYNQVPIPDGKIDARVANEHFAKQLGPVWRGAQNLPNYKKVLLAAFCLKASRKREDSDRMLSELACCWSDESGLKLTGSLISWANKVLASKDLSGATLQAANRHAWQTTAILRALEMARKEGGVLAPAQFVWLRGYDRALWYPLNNLGRKTFHMEAIGAMSHYRSELITDRPIPKPKTEYGLKAITDYMASLSARPIPQLDYAYAKKGGTVKKSKDNANSATGKSAGIKKPKIAKKQA